MFKRLNHDDEYPGTGMGLAMVRTVVQRMGGVACLDSESGQGSQLCGELSAATQR
jgi:signal transduction histidine kinase